MKRYMEELRARHIRECAEFSAALAGRKPDILKKLKRCHWLVEDETRLTLERVTE